jgi:hypothetical protein
LGDHFGDFSHRDPRPGDVDLGLLAVGRLHRLLHTIGPSWTFWLYACSTPLAFVFVLLLVPETKGRTLEQIEKHFMH